MHNVFRFFSVFLCFVLLFSFVVSPFRASAAFTDPFSAAYMAASGVIIDIASEGAKLIASAVSSAVSSIKLTPAFFRNICRVANVINFATPGLKTTYRDFSSLSQSSDITNSTLIIPEETYKEIVVAIGSLVPKDQLEDDGNNWAQIENKLETQTNTTIYVPPDSIWSNAEEVTYARLISDGFLEIAELNKNVETLNDNVLAGNKINWQLLQKIMDLSSYLRTTLAGKLDTINTTLGKLDSTNSTLSNMYTALGTINTTLTNKLTTLNTSIGSLSTTLSGKLDAINTTLSGMYSTLSTKLTTLNTSIGTLNTSIGSLSTTLSGKLDAINTTLSGMYSTLSTKLTTLNTSIGTLNTSIGSLSTTLSGKLDALGTLDTINTTLTNKLSTLNTSIGTLNTSIGSLSTTLSGKLDTLNTTLGQLATLNTSIGSLNTALSGKLGTIDTTLINKLTTLNTSIGTLSTTLSGKLDTLNTTFVDSLAALEFTIGNLVDTLNKSILAGNSVDWDQLNKLMELSGYLRTDFIDALESLELGSGELAASLHESLVYVTGILSSDLSTIDTSIAGLKKQLSTSFYELGLSITSLHDGLSRDLGTVSAAISSLDSTLTSEFSTLRTSIVSKLTSIDSKLTSIDSSLISLPTSLSTLISNINTWDRTMIDRVMENLQQIKNYQVNARDSLLEELQKISGYETTINTNMKDYLQDVKDGLFSLQKNVVYRLQTIETAINNLPAKLGVLDDATLEQLEVIGTSLGLIANPTVTTPDTSVLDEIEEKKKPIFFFAGTGYVTGMDFFGSAGDFLSDELDAFRVVGMIFNEFAEMTFFYKLIVTSASVGLVGTLLGMALNIQSYSVAQRRREEAAQSRAAGRMERSSAA